MELPSAIRNLPGVATTTQTNQATATAATSSASNAGAPAALVWEGSGQSAQSAQRLENSALEFKHDLQQNFPIFQQLALNGTPPDARGLASVSAQANRHPAEFAALVDASRAVSSSMGQNPAAQQQFDAAKAAFIEAANIPKNQTGDVMYLVMRVAQDSVSQNEKSVRESIQKQIENNLKLIDALKQYEKGLQQTATQLELTPTKQVDVVESDFRLDPKGNVERVADSQTDGEVKGDAPLPTDSAAASHQHTKGGTGVAGAAFAAGPSPHTKGGVGLGPQVSNVAMSTTHRPKVVRMDRSNVAMEIKETQMQIAALQKANAQLRALNTTAVQTDIPVKAAWYVSEDDKIT